jgi:hypothetical protein
VTGKIGTGHFKKPHIKKAIVDKAKKFLEKDIINFTQDVIGFRRSRRRIEALQDRIK